MRRLLAALWIIIILTLSFDLVLAGGNHRFTLERKAKRVAEWQERQAERFKALEAESAKLFKKIEEPTQLIRPDR